MKSSNSKNCAISELLQFELDKCQIIRDPAGPAKFPCQNEYEVFDRRDPPFGNKLVTVTLAVVRYSFCSIAGSATCEVDTKPIVRTNSCL
jgi:hypothetical protein